jgi:hypothetical protein
LPGNVITFILGSLLLELGYYKNLLDCGKNKNRKEKQVI